MSRSPSSTFHYLLFYKPYGVLTQFTDPAGRPTLKPFIPISGVYPVGRLDAESEGLLLLTDDGELAHRLIDPRFAHPRTYLAQVERIPDEKALERLRRGVRIQGRRTRPAEVERVAEPSVPPRSVPIRFRKSVPTTWLKITLREGRNRQVRKMTAAVGHPTLRLIRIGIGPLRLEGLTSGEWREMTSGERTELMKILR
jgi:23S rRNA pseudouridine2457 synthase